VGIYYTCIALEASNDAAVHPAVDSIRSQL